jgi:hypothetical protein
MVDDLVTPGPARPATPSRNPAGRATTFFLGLLAGCAGGWITGVACLGTTAAGMLLAALAVRDVLAEPKQVLVSVSTLDSVRVGDEFSIEIGIQNQADRQRVVDSIDVSSELLDGIDIDAARPDFEYKWPFDVGPANFTSFHFDAPLPPLDGLAMRLLAVGRQGGTHAGRLDVCIDTGQSCLRHEIVIRVVE